MTIVIFQDSTVAAIDNETEWLNCEEPRHLARFCECKVDIQRFRWLAVIWGQRVRDDNAFDEENLEIFDAFVARVMHGVETPREILEREVYDPFERPFPERGFSRHCISLIQENNPMRASTWAVYSVTSNFQKIREKQQAEGLTFLSREEYMELDQQGRDAYHELLDQYEIRTLREFCDQFRDVAGNPFRPVTLNRRWLTDSVVQLAKTIDTTGRYELMPILADALQEADCDSEELLAHCREGKVHVRGCWAIDMLLTER